MIIFNSHHLPLCSYTKPKKYAAVTFGSPNIARKKHKRPKWNNVMAETEISKILGKIPLNACHIKL